MADLYTPSLDRATDGNGNPLSGAKMYTYLTETTTPQDAYTDGDGMIVASNPIVADSEGMFDPLFLDPDVTYRIRVTNSTGSYILYDVDPVRGAGDGGGFGYIVSWTYIGTPTPQSYMGGHKFLETVTFPVNFSGSQGEVQSDPASDCVISIRKNDTEIGSATVSPSGAFTFATIGGVTVTFEAGDKLTWRAPDSATIAADFCMTLVGDVA